MIYLILLLVVLSRGDVVPSDEPECQRDRFTNLPPNVTYVPLGSDVTVTCTNPDLIANNLIVQRLNPNENLQCSSNPMCTLDVDSGMFTLHNFQSSYNGTYQFDYLIIFPRACRVNFDIIEAVAPTLQKEVGTFTYSKGDNMKLQPTVTPGLPPATLQWFKDGVMIHEGDSFSVTGVTASDRGHYIANISNIAGNMTVEYTVLIQFPALITLSTTPNVTDPTLINGPITIYCNAIAYPNITEISLWKVVRGNEISVSGVTTTKNNALLSTLNYEASAQLTVQDCSPELYRCRVRNGNYESERNIGICQSAPNITDFQIDTVASTNTTVSLKWAFKFSDVSVTQYEFSYRRTNSGESWKSVQVSTNVNAINLSYNFENLSPGVMYTFRMRAMNEKGYGMYTNNKTFTTFAEPQHVPKGITVERTRIQNIDDIHLHWQTPPVLDHAPVTSYQVMYFNSEDSTPKTEETGLPYFNLTGVSSSLTYFFRLQAKNKWGSSNYSAPVESTGDRDDPNANLVTVQTTVTLSNTKVVVGWTLTGHEYVKNLTIQISLVEIRGPDNVFFHDVYKFNVTSLKNTGQQCFSDLNASDTYQFCVIALLNSGSNKSDCQLGTTTSTNTGDIRDGSSCQSVVGAVIDKEVIPGWAIGVIVVGAVLLVFFVFGGCGLYYGIKRTKKGGTDFDSPHQSLDPIPHNGMNGYPYPQQRAASPGRSCMSYRHHQHQHGMEWPVKEPGITAV